MKTRRDSDRRGFLKTVGFATATAAAATWVPQHGTAAAADSTSDDGTPFPLGLASYTTRKFSLEETVAMCQRLDLKHVCLKSFHLPLDATNDQITAVAKLVHDTGLNLYAGGVISMKRPEDVETAFHYAQMAGMRRIVGVPAPEVLALVDQKVKQFDIEVAIHNHGPGDKVYPTPESAYEKIKNLDPRIGLCMDIGHTLRIGADPIADAKRFADRLLDVHLKDVSAAAPEGKTVEIGRGVIDIPAFLKTLVDIGYTRVAAFEYEKDADDPLPGLAESVGYVRGVLAAI